MSRNVRFFLSLIPPIALGLFVIVAASAVIDRVGGCAGFAMGVIGGGCVGFGILLGYWIAVDWLNLRYVRRCVLGSARPEDGKILAVEGRAQVEGEALRSPFTDTECAAYTYRVSGTQSSMSTTSGSSTRTVTYAEGFHLLPTEIVGPRLSLSLRGLPSFSDSLRETVTDGSWEEGWNRLRERLRGVTSIATDRERQGLLLELRNTEVREAHHDFYPGYGSASRDATADDHADDQVTAADDPPRDLEAELRRRGADEERIEKVGEIFDRLDKESVNLSLKEEIMPTGEDLCWIGTYDASSGSLTAAKERIGPDLMVYRGGGRELASRLQKEVRTFGLTAVILVLVGGGLLGLPFLPAEVTGGLPFLAP